MNYLLPFQSGLVAFHDLFFRPVHNLNSTIQSECSSLHYPQRCYIPVNRRIPLAGHQTWSPVLLSTLPGLVGPFDQWNSWGRRLLLWCPFSSSLSRLLSNQLTFSVSSSLSFLVAAQFTSSCPLASCQGVCLTCGGLGCLYQLYFHHAGDLCQS